MKKILVLCFLLIITSKFLEAATSCGANIKNGAIICYDLKSYNKNPKISLKLGDDGFEGNNSETPEDVNWDISYNLNAVLIYTFMVKKNNKILSINKFQELIPIDNDYELYNLILSVNNKLGGELVMQYGLLPENFHYSYSAKLSNIIKKYDKRNEDEIEITRSEYIIKQLTPLLKPEEDKLKKIEDKRNSILGDDYNKYINSIKEEQTQANNNKILQLEDEAKQIREQTKELDIKIADLENKLNPKGFKKLIDGGEYSPEKEQIRYNLKEVKDKHEELDLKNTEIQKKLKAIKNTSNNEEVSSVIEACTVANFHKAEENSTNIYEATNSYSYKEVTDCYSKFITDENKLETLNTIDNFYIKQHKKVQFIINTIEENKSDIIDYKKKIESDKAKKALEKELN